GRTPYPSLPQTEDTLMFGGKTLVHSRLHAEQRSPWWSSLDEHVEEIPMLFARRADGEEEEDVEDEDEDEGDELDEEDEDLDEEEDVDEDFDEEFDDEEDFEEEDFEE